LPGVEKQFICIFASSTCAESGKLKWNIKLESSCLRVTAMSEQPIDGGRRRFLTVATSAVGGLAAVGAAVPFVLSFLPSERARAAGAPVEFDISKLEPGQKVNVEWQGKPIWLLSRTPTQIKNLASLNGKLVSRSIAVTSIVPSNPNCWLPWGFVPIWAVLRPSVRIWLLPTWGPSGWGASTVLAMGPSSIWLRGCIPGFQRQRIWKFRRTSICLTPAC